MAEYTPVTVNTAQANLIEEIDWVLSNASRLNDGERSLIEAIRSNVEKGLPTSQTGNDAVLRFYRFPSLATWLVRYDAVRDTHLTEKGEVAV